MTRSIQPGTLVKLNTGALGVRRGSPAIVLSIDARGGPRLLTDAAIGEATRREISVPRLPLPPFVPMRLWMPYGVWTEESGSQVLFSRDYCPLWRISPIGEVSSEEPWRWIEFVQEEWFWNEMEAPWLNRKPRFGTGSKP